MTNTAKLKARILEAGETQASTAKELGISEGTFSAKANNKSEFRGSEIAKMISMLALTATDVSDIFFCNV